MGSGLRTLLTEGEARGAVRFFWPLLWLLSWVYRAAVLAARTAAERRWVATYRPRARVISVGNIVLGGTGKTPLVLALSTFLARQGLKVAVLSRGYGRQGEGLGDEAGMLKAELSGWARVFVGADRSALARRIEDREAVDVFLLDDGFQHWRLKRDLDIVALDAARPFANGHVLPAGPLREGPEALGRADVICLTRVDEAPGPTLETTRSVVRALNPEALIVEARHAPVGLHDVASGQTRSLKFLEGLSIGVFCGIARPDSFTRMLVGLGARVVFRRFFADHHAFTAAEIAGVVEEASSVGARAIVTTQKDAERLGPVLRREILVLRVALKIERGERELHDRLVRACAR